MTISIHAKQVFDNIKETFKIKTLMKLEIEERYVHIIKAIEEKFTYPIVKDWEILF